MRAGQQEGREQGAQEQEQHVEPEGEEQEKFRANFKVISSSFASLPLKVPGTAFHRGLKVAASDHQTISANDFAVFARSNQINQDVV